MKPAAILGYQIGLLLSAALLMVLFLPRLEPLRTLGPINTGHSSLVCSDCHEVSQGTPRQQIQANVRYLLGVRKSGVDFRHYAVDNNDCLACHDNPKDNHPVHRFNEPRFASVRASIAPQLCNSCHQEHKGVRVSTGLDFCLHCHFDLSLKNDPLAISHQELIDQEKWESCLGCHDFHGNHITNTPTTLTDALSREEIVTYFLGGSSPYSRQKSFHAKEKR